MNKYEIEIIDVSGNSSIVPFKSVDLAVSHILSSMDLGCTVVFKPIKLSENEN